VNGGWSDRYNPPNQHDNIQKKRTVMPHNFIQFSEVIPQLTDKEESWLRAQLQTIAVLDGQEVELADEKNAPKNAAWTGPRFLRPDNLRGGSYESLDFAFEFDMDDESGRHLWLYGDSLGGPEKVTALVEQFLETCRPDQCWTLTWATHCSRPCVGAFGGGAVFVTAEDTEWYNAFDFVCDEQDEFERKRAASKLAHPPARQDTQAGADQFPEQEQPR